jgi:hypothetical protein
VLPLKRRRSRHRRERGASIGFPTLPSTCFCDTTRSQGACSISVPMSLNIHRVNLVLPKP